MPKLNHKQSYEIDIEISNAIKKGEPSFYSIAKKYKITPAAVYKRAKLLNPK